MKPRKRYCCNWPEQRQPLIITQNGEAKPVIQDVVSYEETQETLLLLEILALGNQDIEQSRVKPVAEVVARLRSNTPPNNYRKPATKSYSRKAQNRV